MSPSLILDTVTRAAFPTVFVFSAYLLFAGHNAPGGGFVGGLVAGTALVLRYAGKGAEDLQQVMPVRFEALVGAGLALAGLTGAGSFLFGDQFLSSAILELHPPLLGDVKLVTALFFDVGVYLVVVGLVLGVLAVLGEPPAEGGPAEAAGGRGSEPDVPGATEPMATPGTGATRSGDAEPEEPR